MPKTAFEPRLAYDDEIQALAFLTSAFGLRETARLEGPDALMAWLAFGESTIMIGRAGPACHNLYSPQRTGKPTAEINVGVHDIDAHYERARQAGAEISVPLHDAPFGIRHYKASDSEGHVWHFMKPLEDIRTAALTRERIELRLIYTDENAALAYLHRVFGFEERARLKHVDGSMMFWCGIDSSILSIGRSDAAQRQYSPAQTGKPTAMMNLHVDQIDAHHHRAQTEGARIVTPLENTAWGYRRYELVDPEGARWHIMQPLTEIPDPPE